MARLKLLGGALLEDDSGSPLTGVAARRHPLALLALLATAPSRTMTRGKLAGLLWTDSPEKRARGRLNTCVHNVRGELGEDVLISAGDELRLNDDALACDVWRFERSLEEEDYGAAVDRYAGPFLDGFRLGGSPAFEKRVDAVRDRLARDYRSALEALAEAAEERGEPSTAAGWWRTRAGEDPYDSRVVRRLMEALAEAGNPAAALRAARAHERLMREELGASPDPTVGELAEELRARSPSEEVPTRVGDPPSGETAWAPPSSVPGTTEEEAESGRRVREEEAKSGSRRAVYGTLVAGVLLAAGLLLADAMDDRGGMPGARAGDRSIAVLPFESLGEDRGDDFAAGIHADLISRLARITGLTVVSGTSVRRYREAREPLPEIAGALGVGWILEGEVQRVGDQVQVNAQLIDARADRHLWAESYRRELTARNLFEIQEELTRRIVAALEVELTPEDERRVASVPTQNTAAYELYLHAERLDDRREAREEANRQRIELYRRAIELDSAFAGAWAGLADAYVGRSWRLEWSEAWADSGRRAARRAIELDPELADGYAELGDALWVLEGGEAPVEAYRKALELQPDHRNAANNLAVLLDRRGELAEKARLLDRLLRTSPRSTTVQEALIFTNVLLGRDGVADAWRGYARHRGLSLPESEFDVALFHRGDVARAREALDELPGPEDGRVRLRRRAALALYGGDREEARRRYRVLYPGRAGASHPIFNGLLEDRLGLAWALDRLGQGGEAREIAVEVAREAEEQIEEGASSRSPRHRLAVARLLLGDTARTLAALEAGVDAGFRSRGTLETVPTLAPLRDHPWFRAIVARVDSLVAEERRRVEENGWAEPEGWTEPG